MWTEEKRQRYEQLRAREDGGLLTGDERAELATLIQELSDCEAAYLAPANERKAQDIKSSAAAYRPLEEQNRRMRAYLREREAFLERVKLVVADLHAQDRRMREHYADVMAIIGGPGAHEAP